MKVLLIFPNSKAHTCTPPVGLGYMASVLIKNGHEAHILDCKKLNMENIAQICEKIKEISPELIGISVMTSNYMQAKEMVYAFKKEFDMPIVLGGTHISALPIDSLMETKADFAVIGEGEITLLELVEALSSNCKDFSKIDGIVFLKEGKAVITKQREFIQDLDSLGFPAWELMPPNTYLPAPQLFFIKRYPVAPIQTSRGCPYACSFCGSAVTWRRSWRARSPKHVVDEIEMLVNKFGVKEIHFQDDNLTLKKERIKAICDDIIKRKLDIVWKCPNGVRIETLDEEVLKKMKQSGCYQLAFGIESGSEKVLKRANKQLSLKKVEEVVNLTAKVGIEAHGFFIIGLPGENKESVIQTINLAKKLPFCSATFPLLTPLPGTEIFDLYLKQKDMKSINWSEINYHTAQYTVDLSAKELKKYQKRAITSFYLSPRVMFNILRKMRFKQIPLFSRIFLDYLIKKN